MTSRIETLGALPIARLAQAAREIRTVARPVAHQHHGQALERIAGELEDLVEEVRAVRARDRFESRP
jgi:hypothetical protein